MANEITAIAGLQLTNGSLVVQVPTVSVKLDQTTGRGGGPGTVDIGTGEETISFGDIVPGYVFMRNLDPTNYVTWGNVTANLDQKLSPGGVPHLVEMVSGGVLIMQAATATCKVQIIAVNI